MRIHTAHHECIQRRKKAAQVWVVDFSRGFIFNSNKETLVPSAAAFCLTTGGVWPCAPGQVLDLVVGMLAEVGGRTNCGGDHMLATSSG